MEEIYKGRGSRVDNAAVPKYKASRQLNDPQGYRSSKELAEAVNVAIALGQPLLLTGEPGTGKTDLAESVAWELGLGQVLKFHTKSTSEAKDLLYTHDALGYFQQVQVNKARSTDREVDINDYITFEAFGDAIKLAMGDNPERRVVLIDEIDKAPRDLPNDLLLELDKMSFEVREINKTFTAQQEFRPIVIITSNTEKNLPAAFLRRCVYFHIDFPGKETLLDIVKWRLFRESQGTDGNATQAAVEVDPGTQSKLDNAVDFFLKIRSKEVDLRKKPATAEMLSWLRVVGERFPASSDHTTFTDEEAQFLTGSFAILVKQNSDRIKLLQYLGWSTGL